MREKFKHSDYWMGWTQITIGGFMLGGVTSGTYTLFVLIFAIPAIVLGFYLVNFKVYKPKSDEIKRGN
jgi:hypothetical protein